MSSFGDNGKNKVFKTGIPPSPPYYYIQASLDLSGRSSGTYYFNTDNNYSYDTIRDYPNFITIGDNVIISEVLVYSSPTLVAADPFAAISLTVGGAANATTSPVVVPWAAPAASAPVSPPGFVGGPLSISEVNGGSVNYFGHEGGHFPYFRNQNIPPVTDFSTEYRFLAVTISSSTQNSLLQTERTRRRQLRGRSLPTGDVVIESGSITVVIKVYPKEQ